MPDREGKPRFVVAGDDGPPTFSDEKRRHIYKAGITPIKIKVMRKSGGAQIWYRVSDKGVTGWQLESPSVFTRSSSSVPSTPISQTDPTR